MAHEIKVPPFGESVTESTIAKWLKPDGASVVKGEDIVSIDTEKASSELQAEVTGRLKILVPAGTDVSIGAVIGQIEEGQVGTAPSAESPASPTAAPGAAMPEPQQQHSRAAERGEPGVIPADSVVSPGKGPLHVAAPQPVPGTAQPSSPLPPLPASPPKSEDKATESAATSPRPSPGDRRETRETMSRLRRTVAAHLLKAKQETAMLTTFAEVDMTSVMGIRSRYQEQFVKKHGIKLGFMSFFMKATVAALQKFPLVNASIEGNEVVHHHYYDIAVAVSTDRGLVVPVIRDCDLKSHADIERELIDIAGRARANKLDLDELKGGTFTITNGGTFGSMLSTPLLNPPQVGILGMHAIEERPVAINGKVEIRPMMYLALSYDHRLIDGKEAVQFLVAVRDHVASPERAMLGL